ncbi:response regulator [Verrucomicrobiota bacterium sgz303538]
MNTSDAVVASYCPQSVLLLDDDPDLAAAFRTLLEDRGFEVTIASDGVDGLKEVVARDFDVILCDVEMPHLPGDMFYLAVSKAKPHLCERFLFITAHQGSPRTINLLEHVDSLVLFKPVRVGDLLNSISFVRARSRNRSDFRLRLG